MATGHAQAVIAEEKLDALSQPVLEAATMPPEAYWSQEAYEREVERIFMRSWICVGRADEIPAVGDYFTQDIAGEPLVIVRDGDGEIHAHFNVCRHRGCPVVDGAGTTRAFRCPYHGWMYGLNGELRGTPDFKETLHFDKRDYPLHSASVELWRGYIMVNLDPGAAPFHEQVSETTRFGIQHYELEDHVTTHRFDYELDCNWKVYVENYIEEYHVPWVHADTFQPVTPMKGWVEFPDITSQPWAVMVGQFPGFTFSDTGEPMFPVTPATAKLAPEHQGMPIWLGFPSFGVLPTVDSSLYYMILPKGPERCELKVRLCLPRRSAEALAAGDEDVKKIAEQYAHNVEVFVAEDNVIAELQQRGLRSRRATQGRFSKHEGLAWEFDKWVADVAYRGEGQPAGNGRVD